MSDNIPTGANPAVLPPFKAWLASNIPAVYDNTMSYYDELTSLIHYLETVILPALNEDSSAITTLSNLYKELKSYVENYFKNLDVQEEINNKLDQMAEDGTLERLISDYIDQSIKMFFPQLSLSGDLSVIQFKNGNETKNIIIDFGKYDQTDYVLTKAKLENLNITKFDYAFISHYHQDHVGFLSYMLDDSDYDFSDCTFYLPPSPDWESFIGSARYMPEYETNIKAMLTAKNIPYVIPTNNTEIEIFDAKINFFNCDTNDFATYYDITYHVSGIDYPITNYNNFSMVNQITFKNKKLLFTGDIEAEAERICMTQGLSRCDFIKAEHHGSDTLQNHNYNYVHEVFRPDVVVAMCTYGDNVNTLPLLKYQTALYNVYVTSVSGDVTITTSGYAFSSNSTNGQFFYNDISTQEFANAFGLTEALSLGLVPATYYIQENDDLNDYTTAGTYSSEDQTITASLLNKPPISGRGFKMIVLYIVSLRRVVQIAMKNASTTFYFRYGGREMEEEEFTWQDWETLQTNGYCEEIAKNTDIDTLTWGNYYCPDGTRALTLTNIPTGLNSAFNLNVRKLVNKSERVIQEIIPATIPKMYMRIRTSTGWSSWYEFTGNVVS